MMLDENHYTCVEALYRNTTVVYTINTAKCKSNMYMTNSLEKTTLYKAFIYTIVHFSTFFDKHDDCRVHVKKPDF